MIRLGFYSQLLPLGCNCISGIINFWRNNLSKNTIQILLCRPLGLNCCNKSALAMLVVIQRNFILTLRDMWTFFFFWKWIFQTLTLRHNRCKNKIVTEISIYRCFLGLFEFLHQSLHAGNRRPHMTLTSTFSSSTWHFSGLSWNQSRGLTRQWPLKLVLQDVYLEKVHFSPTYCQMFLV